MIKLAKKMFGLSVDLFMRRQYKKIIKKLEIGNVKNILDVGGGRGIFANLLKKRFPLTECYVLDFDKREIDRGRESFPNVNFIHHNAEGLPFKENEFDLIVCKDVLHHCEEPEDVVKEISRVGKKAIIMESVRGNKWLDTYLKNHPHFFPEEFKKIVNPKKMKFSDVSWPPVKLIPLFSILPVIPKSKKSTMIGYL